MLHIAQRDAFASYLPHFTSPSNTVIILVTSYPVSSDIQPIIVLMGQKERKIHQVNSNFVTEL